MNDKPKGGMRQKPKKSRDDHDMDDKKLPKRGQHTAKNRANY